MLQTDITILKQREKVLEKEIDEALSHTSIDDLMIVHLKSRILYLKEEIDRLRHEDFASTSLARESVETRGRRHRRPNFEYWRFELLELCTH